MKASKNKNNPEFNNSPMADIAFLLLVFFLVVTTIEVEQGIRTQINKSFAKEIKDSNHRVIILVNSDSEIMLQEKIVSMTDLTTALIEAYDVSPGVKNVISIKTERQVPYQMFIEILDNGKKAKRGFYDKLSLNEYELNFHNLSRSFQSKMMALHPVTISEEVL